MKKSVRRCKHRKIVIRMERMKISRCTICEGRSSGKEEWDSFSSEEKTAYGSFEAYLKKEWEIWSHDQCRSKKVCNKFKGPVSYYAECTQCRASTLFTGSPFAAGKLFVRMFGGRK